MKISVLLLLTTLRASVFGYNILCVFPVPSWSHFQLAKGIVDALLDAGHQVTWATPFTAKAKKNLKQIDLGESRTLIESMNVTGDSQMSSAMMHQFFHNISLSAITSQPVREAVVKEKYDAVVTEWFFSDIEAGYAAVQQVPWIVLNSLVMHPYMEYLMEAVRSLPVVPSTLNDFPVPMTFWHRLQNTFASCMVMLDTWLYLPQTISAYEEHFSPLAAAKGVPLPPFHDALHNISITFVNSHPSFSHAFNLPPNVIEIAGYHIAEDTPPLPQDLQEILDLSSNGVVYFSMGSVLKASDLPAQTIKDLIRILGEVPYTILWKLEAKMDGLPKNVHIRPWTPQASVLAHPNVKAFITHGGLLSTLESLRYGVPIVAVPVFGDQPGNADRSVRAGHAIKVKYSPHMAPDLKEAVTEIMKNDSYYKTAKAISKLFNNRPVKQSKLISHYVELAIESKGAYHLRCKSRLYKWYELCMIDQVLVVFTALLIVVLMLKKIVRLITKKTLNINETIEEEKTK